MDDREVVSALRIALADKVGQDRFEVWFGETTRLAISADKLIVTTPSRFTQDWLRSNLRGEIAATAALVLGKPVDLEFRVDASLNGGRRAAAPKSAATQAAADRQVAEAGAAQKKSTAAFVRQYAQLDDFVVGPCNRLAFASAQMVIDNPGSLSPLVLCGGTGVGKTLLMEGILTAARRTHRSLYGLYLSAEQFTTQFVEALKGSGLPSFRRKYRGVDLLLIDDLQFFSGKRATVTELQGTIDTLLSEKKQLVFASDKPPGELADLSPELTSRLQGGLVCQLDAPNHATRLGIVGKLAARLKIDVPPSVQMYIATHCTSQSRELRGALLRLQATSQALGQPITLPLAEDALADLVRGSGRTPRLADIDRAVCHVFGLEADALHSQRKARAVAQPRMLAMWLARKHTRAALAEIGQFFGRRSHSTVISAQKNVHQWMHDQSSLNLADRSWNVEDAIRQVEEKLRVG